MLSPFVGCENITTLAHSMPSGGGIQSIIMPPWMSRLKGLHYALSTVMATWFSKPMSPAILMRSRIGLRPFGSTYSARIRSGASVGMA
ncbi:MAG: hypothetical protein FD152_3836, partial [Xanthobacteraceae bacterium]